MQIRTIPVLVATNALLLVGNAFIPGATVEAALAPRDCCTYSIGGQGFCCDNCCWITNDCNFSSECPNRQT